MYQSGMISAELDRGLHVSFFLLILYEEIYTLALFCHIENLCLGKVFANVLKIMRK